MITRSSNYIEGSRAAYAVQKCTSKNVLNCEKRKKCKIAKDIILSSNLRSAFL